MLIQARAPGHTFARDASLRQAVRQVAAALAALPASAAHIQSPLTRELWSRGSSAQDAVVGGIASSAGVVTSAALIMVAVFSIFATLPLVDLKILGIGTAAAVLIDATVVRGILVPAALALLGERAWRGRRALRA
ncbi:MAG TPA: MMPL family transporter [Streptosporangiaceae bacterium]|nr:MMPL family transporter [Streptosporangiaceae bacterium]